MHLINMAVAMRQCKLADSIPAGIKTASPPELSRWFARKMRFDLHLSVHPHGSVQRSPHCLLGGSMARFRRVDAAYVAYDVRNELVNLLIAAETPGRRAS
jgi:hypothetical protein